MKKIKLVVVGYGWRGKAYTEYCTANPDRYEVVGVVDTDPFKVKQAKEKFGLSDDMCFNSLDEFAARGKIADCIINSTMDSVHVETALPLLKLKYDMLLEKPVTNNASELMKIKEATEKYGNKLIICHVLRYTPFYVKIKELIMSGKIGRVRHIETSENVAIPHASSSYIRGKWNNRKKCGSSYLLAKCCHDMDLLCWLSGKTPEYVSSMGGRNFFIKENAPVGAGTRCLLDCKCEKDCIYSVRKFAVSHNPFADYIWENYLDKEFTPEERLRNLTYDNPHGECVFKTDSDLIDQQISVVKFEDGVTATHTLYSAAPKACRRIRVYGEYGEIAGVLDESDIRMYMYNPDKLTASEEKIDIDMNKVNRGHAGGDWGIMEDLYHTLCGEKPSISCTDIRDSINGHLLVYASDAALEENKVVKISDIAEGKA